MPARWSADSVLALAPDDASRRAAAPLARPGQWGGSTGSKGDLVWGLCAGSGKNPYQVIADLAGPAFKCSCPSRKFPCKHTLGLLLLWSAGTVPDEQEPADYAREWHDARQAKAQSKSSSPTVQGVSPAASDADAGAGPGSAKDETGAARRAAERAERVADGLADLREWLLDQVRSGLAGSDALGGPSAGRQGGAELMAARMVDAQAPGAAAALRGLAGATGGVPARLLSEYALLHLLVRAHERLDELPADLAAVVRSRVGYPVSRDEVLARPAVTDDWAVLAVRELTDAKVPGRRIWLRGRATGRPAMLLSYAAPNGAWQDPGIARLRPGDGVRADLHFFPGQPELRALLGDRDGEPAPAPPPAPAEGIDGLLADWSAALERDPWLTAWPALLTGTPVPSTDDGARWHLADADGAALPLADRDSVWTLLAVSGGRPVTVAGEWNADGLVALTTWHGDEAVAL